MSKIYVEVKVKYRDDKESVFESWDTPSVGSDYITIYPKNRSPLARQLIPKEAIAEINWEYKSK
jgi:hypothetical protein